MSVTARLRALEFLLAEAVRAAGSVSWKDPGGTSAFALSAGVFSGFRLVREGDTFTLTAPPVPGAEEEANDGR